MDNKRNSFSTSFGFVIASAASAIGTLHEAKLKRKSQFGKIWIKYLQELKLVAKFAPTFAGNGKSIGRDGRVVDYTGLENRRAARHRGFESLSLRKN